MSKNVKVAPQDFQKCLDLSNTLINLSQAQTVDEIQVSLTPLFPELFARRQLDLQSTFLTDFYVEAFLVGRNIYQADETELPAFNPKNPYIPLPPSVLPLVFVEAVQELFANQKFDISDAKKISDRYYGHLTPRTPQILHPATPANTPIKDTDSAVSWNNTLDVKATRELAEHLLCFTKMPILLKSVLAPAPAPAPLPLSLPPPCPTPFLAPPPLASCCTGAALTSAELEVRSAVRSAVLAARAELAADLAALPERLREAVRAASAGASVELS